MSERFNVLMCKFYKFYICAVVGIIIQCLLTFHYFLSAQSSTAKQPKLLVFITTY